MILCNLFNCPNHASAKISSDFSTVHSYRRDIAFFFPNLTSQTRHSLTILTARARLKKKLEICEPSRLSTWSRSGNSYIARFQPLSRGESRARFPATASQGALNLSQKMPYLDPRVKARLKLQ